jgi:electron-transferring-flavoprotein dehydrogenase
MKSGMTAADAVFEALATADPGAAIELTDYPARLKRTWLWPELTAARNIRPGFRAGLWAGLLHAAIDTYILRGRAPWTWHHHAAHKQLAKAAASRPIAYPKPDGVLTFDRLSSVFISNTSHEENQPSHLKLRDPERAIAVNLADYDAPETRYCPAGVYEIIGTAEGGAPPRLQINAANCVHCKSCDIKDPTQNIDWVVPEGGGGPNYPNM